MGSIVDLNIVTKTPNLTVEQINDAYRAAAESGPLAGILQYSEEPLVSSDIVQDPHPSIFDSALTAVQDKLVRVSAWYDNEWGYTWQLVKLTEFVAAKL